MGLTLDASPLISADRGEERFDALVEGAQRRGQSLAVASVTLAEVYRGTADQARLFKVIRGLEVVGIDIDMARRIGHLLHAAGSGHVLDACAVVVAVARNDAIVTSDLDDITILAQAAGVTIRRW